MTEQAMRPATRAEKIVKPGVYEVPVEQQQNEPVQKVTLGTNEALRVTADGQFIWHPDADRMIEEGDYTANPELRFILRELRKRQQPTAWVGLTDEEREAATGWSVEHIEAALRSKNT